MTELPESGSQAPPKWVLIVAVLLLAIAAWPLLRTYTSAAGRECLALYRSARTAADTARVDSTVTPGNRALSEPHSCGFTRIAARW